MATDSGAFKNRRCRQIDDAWRGPGFGPPSVGPACLLQSPLADESMNDVTSGNLSMNRKKLMDAVSQVRDSVRQYYCRQRP